MNINQIKGHYSGQNPYRDLLSKSIQKFFGNEVDGEMWSLGGKECLEYKHLTDFGLKFKEYHNVDRDSIDKTDGVIDHPNTEFLDTWRFFKNPKILSYDSTEGIVKANHVTWRLLINMVEYSFTISNEILFVCNFMNGYSNTEYNNYERCRALWITSLCDKFRNRNIKIIEGGYKEGRKDNSTIIMTGLSFYLKR